MLLPRRATVLTKSDCPGQSANHQAPFFCSFSQPDSSHQPSIQQMRLIRICPDRVKLYLPQNRTHKSAIFPRHCHSKPYCQQAPTGACPCPEGQPTPAPQKPSLKTTPLPKAAPTKSHHHTAAPTRPHPASLRRCGAHPPNHSSPPLKNTKKSRRNHASSPAQR